MNVLKFAAAAAAAAATATATATANTTCCFSNSISSCSAQIVQKQLGGRAP